MSEDFYTALSNLLRHFGESVSTVEWDGEAITVYVNGEPMGRQEFKIDSKTYQSFEALEQACADMPPQILVTVV